MYVYTIEDLGSSGFKETTSVMIHPTVIQYITIIVLQWIIHGEQKWLIMASQK